MLFESYFHSTNDWHSKRTKGLMVVSWGSCTNGSNRVVFVQIVGVIVTGTRYSTVTVLIKTTGTVL